MLIYLDHAHAVRIARCNEEGRPYIEKDLYAAIVECTVERVRHKMMTVAAIVASLSPILWSTGTGSEVMKWIAAPV